MPITRYDPWCTAPPWAFELRDQLALTLNKLSTMEAQMPILDEVKAAVEENRNATRSAVALINLLHTKLDEALEAGDVAKAQEILAEIKADTQEIVDATLANTPADPNAGGGGTPT